MQRALEILGYPCYHGLVLIANTYQCKIWNKALDAKFLRNDIRFGRDDWDELLGDFGAVADLPAIIFIEEFLENYPNAKVVLVRRPIESWYRSFNEGIILPVWNPILNLLAWVDTSFIGRLGSTSARWTSYWMRASSREEMQNNAKLIYEEHYALVERVTPASRLLKYSLQDGWEPLCKFLDRPVPTTPFPHVNEAAALREKMSLIVKRGIRNASLKWAPYILTVTAIGMAIWTNMDRLG
jgi:hypothetical protein